MAAHLLNISFDHVHTHATPGNVGHLLGGGEAWRKDQHADLFIRHAFIHGHPLRHGFRQNTFAVQPRAIVSDFDTDIAP